MGPYIYHDHTKGRCGGGDPEIYHVFADCIAFKTIYVLLIFVDHKIGHLMWT